MAGRIIFSVMAIIVSLSGAWGVNAPWWIWWGPDTWISTTADSPAGSPNFPPILFEETVSMVPAGAATVEEDFIFLRPEDGHVPSLSGGGSVPQKPAQSPPTRKFLNSAHH
ncbi:hypothetical protein CDL15_Pgr012601 [Punica granatum]|uniref:Uncharacterized protein n=1 Tax=Punica granatum TaxID=22663 RepID=A0A218XYB2_PUNGR|nr:hypothetical protein CDL15_Pgr012601 [Punica granatum]PKH47738.1 hypothetical protein CRG98_050457 [Punica granatum]